MAAGNSGPDIDERLSSREWSEAMVRAGYVVIHMSHVARTAAELASLYGEFGLTLSSGPDCFNSLQVDRPRDAGATLNALPQITANFPILKGRMDSALSVAPASRGRST